MNKIKAEKLFKELGYIKVPGRCDDEIVYYNKETKNLITIDIKSLYVNFGNTLVSWEEINAINLLLDELISSNKNIKRITKRKDLEKELKKIEKIKIPNIIKKDYPEWNENDNCKNCEWNKKIKEQGVYIGDSPCEWCQHNPWKITCAAGK